MKRDLDLVRKILLACEAHPNGHAPRDIQIEGAGEEQIGFHIHLMVQAGLLEGADVTHRGSSSPQAIAQSITWDGYEFLEASRDEGRWATAKQAAGAAGGFTLEAMKTVLVGLATAAAQKAVGLAQ